MLKVNVSVSLKEKYKLCEFLVIMGDKSKASPFINQSGELPEMRFIKMGHILTFPCFVIVRNSILHLNTSHLNSAG